MFLRLFQVVCRHNIINISLSYNTPSSSELLRRLLVKMDDDDEQTVAKALRQKIEDLLETFDISLKEDTYEKRTNQNNDR